MKQQTILLTLLLAKISTSAFPPSLRQRPIILNRIKSISKQCDASNLNLTIAMELPFKGRVFARDFAQECNTIGTLSPQISISLPTSGCGMRLSRTKSNLMVFSVILVIQQDKHLRQIADVESRIECIVPDSAFLVNSQTMRDALKEEAIKKNQHRIGRMKDEGWSKELEGKPLEDELNAALKASRAWMEIVSETLAGTLQVGETAVLVVKSTLPAGVAWKVVDCVAHDGIGDSSQKLLDEVGCPLDELLMPTPKMGPIRQIALMRQQEAVAKFPAFKFPDRDRLHLSCGLQLCRAFCPKVNCSLDQTRLARHLDEDGEIIDRLEVFNSVEVLAPEIDDLRNAENGIREPSTYPFSNLPGDRTFCVSPDKMALAFCILGLIFLGAVVVAACALMRSRRNNQNVPYYTRSLFSSSNSSGGESGFGSKTLLHDSSCLSQSTARGMPPYGRIL